MKQQEAENLLSETFNKEFNSDKFISFLKELLKGKLSINPKSSSPHKEFEEYIKSFKKIGEYKNGRNNIEILIVELKKTSSLERARTMQRNFIAKWLNSDYSPKDGALVAFYGDNPEDWRFSFVKMDYKFGDDGKVIKELTPAKRYSFLVGKNEPNHTCKKQFLKLLTEETIPPTIEEIETAFSVDNVTREFFDQYKDRFIQLKESIEEIIKKNSIVRKEFEVKSISPTEFSKKLLGQIVFLYFLQKKGWLGVKKDSEGKFNEWGTGPKDFMKRLFNKEMVNYENFFNDVLEPLFYQALANDRSADKDYYEKLKCKVPFLNGGLFEPIKDYDWTKTDILIDNNIFKDIFSTFDQFNFTIKEDEPLEREVAVDPEMLGKVFENLLDVDDRKSKGAFYTPREIVHYMCQQSLINYLETNTSKLEIKREDIELFILKGDIALDRLRRIQMGRYDDIKLILPQSITSNYKELDRLLREIKICDPAVGSGAFPVGMMNEIVRARNILTYFFLPSEKAERTDYNLKRQTIENSLYGVDLESSAVEITKLRFWLSLIVDELDMKNIRPLPNLDNRIMCGNSLIEEFEGVKLFDENLANEKVAKQMTLFKKGSEYKLETLQNLQSTYFNEQDRNKKKKLMKDIESLEWEFIDTTLREQGNEEAMKKLEQYKNSKSKPFFLWKLYFSDVFRRENPGFDVVIGNPPYVNTNELKELREVYRRLYHTAYGSYDIYVIFFERGMDLLREEGILSFITSNKFLISDYGIKLREMLLEKFNLISLIDLADCKRVFNEALVSPSVSFIKKNSSKNKSNTLNLAILKDDDIKSLFDIRYTQFNLSNFNKGAKTFDIYINPKEKIILEKLSKESKILSSVAEVRTGVMGFDYWSLEPFIHNEKKEKSIRIATNSFIDRYSFLWGKKVNLYKKNFNNTWLDLNKCKLNENTKTLFKTKKIIIRGVAQRLTAQLDKEGIGLLVAVHSAIPKDEKNFHPNYLLALLNSSLFNWYHLVKFYTARIPEGSLKYPISFLKQLPIKDISEKQQKPLIELVDKILSITDDEDYLKNDDKQAMVVALEKRIDKIIYELYELTLEEIKLIDNFKH